MSKNDRKRMVYLLALMSLFLQSQAQMTALQQALEFAKHQVITVLEPRTAGWMTAAALKELNGILGLTCAFQTVLI